jgi:hypothetical protein
MIERLIQLYNQVDRLFDRRALRREWQISRELDESHEVTARQAFRPAFKAAQELDRGSRLTLITGHDVQPDGSARRWEFFFDLPVRRAKLVCDWSLRWDSSADSFGPARLEVVARPFPPAESVYCRMVTEGKLLHRQLNGLWTQEQRRSPKLPFSFTDTDVVMADFVLQGLDPSADEFSFGTALLPDGQPGWIALTHDNQAFYSAIE